LLTRNISTKGLIAVMLILFNNLHRCSHIDCMMLIFHRPALQQSIGQLKRFKVFIPAKKQT
ncbi:MAG TPA: hypothetical protein VE467_13920, partial [Chryseolinea sp.]|nr:hypothetical protein [Chryseolinea sp.]